MIGTAPQRTYRFWCPKCLFRIILVLMFLLPAAEAARAGNGPRHAWPCTWTGIPTTDPETPYLVSSREPHRVRLLIKGFDELAARLELIDQAKTTICMESFLFQPDRSGRLILQALARKAREGVRVSLLLDKSPLFGGSVEFLRELGRRGVQVRLYNDLGGWTLNPRGKWRDHRKYLSIDGRAAIIGGRNQSDAYFGLASHTVFLDCGVLVAGPIVEKLDQAFAGFFHHTSSRRLLPNHDLEKEWETLFQPTQADRLLREYLHSSIQTRNGSPSEAICSNVLVASDRPGHGRDRRRVHDLLWSRISACASTLTMISPTFVLRDRAPRNLLHRLLKQGVRIDVTANSRSDGTGSWLVRLLDSLTRDHLRFWEQKGITVNELPATSAPHKPSIHAKVVVFDRRSISVGSYNMDPQSRKYSAEMVLLIEDCPQFAQAIETAFCRGPAHHRNSRSPALGRALSDFALKTVGVSLLPLYF